MLGILNASCLTSDAHSVKSITYNFSVLLPLQGGPVILTEHDPASVCSFLMDCLESALPCASSSGVLSISGNISVLFIL